MDFKEQIKMLIALQELDAEIYDLEARKETFPVRIKEMDDTLEQKKGGMNAAEDALKQLQVTKNEKEVDMQAKEEKIAKHQSDLYQIKNNKEYEALQREIESIKADVSLLEEEIISLFDQIESAQGKCAEEKKAFEEEARSDEQEKEQIRTEDKQVSEKLAALGNEREAAAAGVDREVITRYERIRESRGRVALAKVIGESCGGCNMHLRPQLINEAQLMKGMVFCENCSRMLYAEE